MEPALGMFSLALPLILFNFFSTGHSYSIEPGVVPTINLIHHERRGIDESVLLENGKAAQQLNSKFSSMTSDSPCKTGDMACIAGNFVQCVGGKFVGGPCAQGLKCFAMPLLLKKGTTLGCDTEADATSRISNTGATGGLTGAGGSEGKNSSITDPTASGDSTDAPTTNGTVSEPNGKADDAPSQTTGTDSDMKVAKGNSSRMDSSLGSSNPADLSQPVKDGKNLKKDSQKGSGAGNNSTSETDIDELNPPPKGSTKSTSSGDQKNQSSRGGKDDQDVEDTTFESSDDDSGEKDCKDAAD